MKSKISKETTTTIHLTKGELYPTLLLSKKAPSRQEFPNFKWDGSGLKKVTKFRYFIVGIKLWFLLLKNRLLNKEEK